MVSYNHDSTERTTLVTFFFFGFFAFFAGFFLAGFFLADFFLAAVCCVRATVVFWIFLVTCAVSH